MGASARRVAKAPSRSSSGRAQNSGSDRSIWSTERSERGTKVGAMVRTLPRPGLIYGARLMDMDPARLDSVTAPDSYPIRRELRWTVNAALT